MAGGDERANQIERAGGLGSDRDDPDVRPGVGNLGDDVGAGELPLGEGPAGWEPEAVERLRALELRVDEVALEVRRQDPCAGPLRRRPGRAHRLQHAAQRRRPARNRRRTERGDPVARQAPGHVANRVGAVERVHTLDAVHVDVDEAGDDVVAREVEGAGRPPPRGRRGNLDDAIAVDDDRAGVEHAVRQDEVRAGEGNHARESAASRAAPIATPSSPSGEISRRNCSSIAGDSRRPHSRRTGLGRRSPAFDAAPLA